MQRLTLIRFIGVPVCLAFLLNHLPEARAQLDPLKEYPLVAEVSPMGEELSSQPNLWMMEVQMKPVRMISVTLTNPETGEQQVENVWYIVYKAVNRPLPFKQDMSDTAPQNDEDQEPLEPLFVPVFTLRTDDITNGEPVQKTYQDVVLPEAQAAINRREGREYKNSVEIMQPVPEPTPKEQGDANALYGVVMWRGVDRNTDYFTIYMTGFSNGYRYVNDPVSFDRLRELAENGELKPGDAVWDGAADIRTASEICNWKESIKPQIDGLRDWRSAASVGGLMDDVKTPPPDARDRLWYYTKTAERYPREKRPPVWRRAIIQHFSRFGDQVNESEDEFRACREPRWRYWPDAGDVDDAAVPAKPENVTPNSENPMPNPENGSPDSGDAPANN